ncbi:MAG: DUF192 domain-containing protein [Actinomycetota bacterium]
MSGFPLVLPRRWSRTGARTALAALLAVAALALGSCGSSPAAQAPPSGSASSASPGPSPTTFDPSGFPSPSGSVANPAQSLPVGVLTVSGGGQTKLRLDVQIAATSRSQSVGLMGIETLPPTLGMAFMFGASVNLAFWMEDTLIPLDIAFWNSSGKVVTVLSMVPCTTNPCKLYYPSSSYVGAVEMQAGLIKKDGLKTGDTVKLSK